MNGMMSEPSENTVLELFRANAFFYSQNTNPTLFFDTVYHSSHDLGEKNPY